MNKEAFLSIKTGLNTIDIDDGKIKLFHGNCLDIIEDIVQYYKSRHPIIVSDPPFNIGYKYNNYDAYTHKEKFHYGGHGSKSVFLAQYYIKLRPVEAVAINCHMSCWDGNTTVGSAFEQFPFAWLLHVADESATYVVEGKRE